MSELSKAEFRPSNKSISEFIHGDTGHAGIGYDNFVEIENFVVQESKHKKIRRSLKVQLSLSRKAIALSAAVLIPAAGTATWAATNPEQVKGLTHEVTQFVGDEIGRLECGGSVACETAGPASIELPRSTDNAVIIYGKAD
jgi:hypothetical protein